jgi:hypothetical protein
MRKALARRNEALTSNADNCNSGKIRGYNGTRPANADTALSGNTLLFELTFGATAYAAVSAGVLTANAIASDVDADATGTCSFVRVFESDGTTVYGDYGVTTSSPAPGTECQLNTLAIVQHAVVSCSAFTESFGVGA